MRLSGQFLAYLFFFIYKKILSSQKRKSNQNQLTKQKQPNKKQQRQQFLCTQIHQTFFMLKFFRTKIKQA